jgi:enamine deaminase RidA (YjgF/YER057c/UK114 family)
MELPKINYENKLRLLGIELPPAWKDDNNRVRALKSGNYVYMSGHGPLNEESAPLIIGKLGSDLTIDQGYYAARITGLRILGTLKGLLGSINPVKRVLKVIGFVNCAPGFNNPSLVMNGFSDLMIEVFGESGRHARSAIGVAELYSNIPVEIEVIFEIES